MTWPPAPTLCRAGGPSSPTAPDRASTPAPVWRSSSRSGASPTCTRSTAGSRHGRAPASRWSRGLALDRDRLDRRHRDLVDLHLADPVLLDVHHGQAVA